MRYKLTLLKDLPDYRAGSVFIFRGMDKSCGGVPYCRVTTYEDGRELGRPFDDPAFINDADWIKKEIDDDLLSDLSCPKCGSTKGVFFSHDYFRRDMDCYDYGVQYSVGFECVCGHKRVIYGTEYGNKRLREIMEVEQRDKG